MNEHLLPEFKVALVADEDEFFRVTVGRILTSRFGFSHVVKVGSFDEAVEFIADPLEGQGIGLAIFDFMMPGVGNPASLWSIREAAPELPIIVTSASERKNDIIGSLEAGVHGYVPKRMGTQELVRALRRVLAGEIYVPAFLPDLWKEGGNDSNSRYQRGPVRRPPRVNH